MVFKMAYDAMVAFTCPRTITIMDWRLGFIHKALVVAIVGYVCWNLFQSQLFLMDSLPLGLVSVWATPTYNGQLGVASFDQARDDFFEKSKSEGANDDGSNTSHSYCDNKTYDYVYDAHFTYREIGCKFAQAEEVSVKGESQIFFTTMLQEKSVAYVPAPKDNKKCSRQVFTKAGFREDECPIGANFTRALGRCYCRATKNSFVAAVENMTLNLEHKYDAMYGQGVMPRTFVRAEGSNVNLHEFAPGQVISMPLYKILDFLRMSLDHRSEHKPDAPHVRLKGLQITAKLQYYNYHQAPGMEKQVDGKPGETVCILEFSPQDMWSTLGDSVNHFSSETNKNDQGGFVDSYRYGIKIVIQASGVISKMDVMFLINAVIQGLVLLNVAVVVTQQIAFYMLGDRSKMYKEFGNETALFEREAARFAIQAIVAGYVFQVIDEDKNGSLDQGEILKAIKDKVPDSGLSEEEMDVLAGFVVHQAELAREADGGDGEKGEVDPAGWDNLFTSSFMDFHSLSRTIKALDKEHSSHLLERAKAFKSGLKAKGYGAV